MTEYQRRVAAMPQEEVPAAYGGTGADALYLRTARCVCCGDDLPGTRQECGQVKTANDISITAAWCDDSCYRERRATMPSDYAGDFGPWRATMGVYVEPTQ